MPTEINDSGNVILSLVVTIPYFGDITLRPDHEAGFGELVRILSQVSQGGNGSAEFVAVVAWDADA